jgi:hypothetical protein
MIFQQTLKNEVKALIPTSGHADFCTYFYVVLQDIGDVKVKSVFSGS